MCNCQIEKCKTPCHGASWACKVDRVFHSEWLCERRHWSLMLQLIWLGQSPPFSCFLQKHAQSSSIRLWTVSTFSPEVSQPIPDWQDFPGHLTAWRDPPVTSRSVRSLLPWNWSEDTSRTSSLYRMLKPLGVSGGLNPCHTSCHLQLCSLTLVQGLDVESS